MRGVDDQPLEILYACVEGGREIAYVWGTTLAEACRRAKSHYGHEGDMRPTKDAEGKRITR